MHHDGTKTEVFLREYPHETSIKSGVCASSEQPFREAFYDYSPRGIEERADGTQGKERLSPARSTKFEYKWNLLELEFPGAEGLHQFSELLGIFGPEGLEDTAQIVGSPKTSWIQPGLPKHHVVPDDGPSVTVVHFNLSAISGPKLVTDPSAVSFVDLSVEFLDGS